MVIDAFKAMDQAHGALPLPTGGGTGENEKQLEKLRDLMKKYADERELIHAAELDRELVKLDHWFNEQREKLRDLGASNKEYNELVTLYTEKHQLLRAEKAAKLADMEAKEHEKRKKQREDLEKAHTEAMFEEQERAVRLRMSLQEMEAESGLVTEQERIRRRYEGEREILKIQGERILATIKEGMYDDEILAVMERYAQVQKQITEQKRLEVAEIERANLAGDADRQIRLINEGLGKQNLLIEETSAKVSSYERLWAYAHGSVTGYMASLYDVGLNVFLGMEDSITRFAMTGKLRFRDFANSVIADLMRIAVRAAVIAPIAQGLFGMFMGGGGSSINLSGGGYGFSGLPTTYFPPMAGGGDVYPGTTYKVGERGIELFTPSVPGKILPNDRLGSGNVKVQIINESGTKMEVTDSAVRVDPQEMVVSLWIDAAVRNKYGLRTILQGA
jgi:hypothetical protein